MQDEEKLSGAELAAKYADCHFGILDSIYDLVKHREEYPVEGSYTNYLINKGPDYILKKVGEECTEAIIAFKNRDRDELVHEISDLLYHVTVAFAHFDVDLDTIFEELIERRSM